MESDRTENDRTENKMKKLLLIDLDMLLEARASSNNHQEYK
jgi:hypothetical protein